MPDAPEMPAATTPEGVNIHLGYIRRDLLDMKTQNSKDLQDIKKSISELGDHYISEEAFKPVADQVAESKITIEAIKEWKDNLQGKMIGFGAGLAIASSGLTAALVHFFGG